MRKVKSESAFSLRHFELDSGAIQRDLNALRCERFVQSGRSLVETLAVLAVIVLLLLSSIVGYNFLVRQYRKQTTVKQISELSVRYKARPIQSEKVKIKDVYPEADLSDVLTMKTVDDGRVHLEVKKDTSSFAVVVNQILDDTCESLLRNGNYDVVVSGDDIDTEIATKLNAYSRDYLLNDPEGKKIFAQLCAPSEGGHKVGLMGLVFGDNCPTMGASYWYNGRCWNCASDREQDSYGNCCERGQVDECGFCPGKCPNGGVCDRVRKLCVECTEDGHCAGRADGKLKCDTQTDTCVECTNVGSLCEGTGPGTGVVNKYCTRSHVCHECNPEHHMHWNRDLDICECATPLIGRGESCFGGCCMSGTTCHNGVCAGCWADYDPEAPGKEGACQASTPLCINGLCQGCPSEGVAEGDSCALRICPGCASGTGLLCMGNSGDTFGVCRCPEGLLWNPNLRQCTECVTDAHCTKNANITGKTFCDAMGTCNCPEGTYLVDGQCLKCKPGSWEGCSSPLPWCKAATIFLKTCVECLQDNHCSGNAMTTGKTVCRLSDNTCHCPADKVWDSSQNKCVDCLMNSDCAGNEVCDTSYKVCCPSDKPYWDNVTQSCKVCLDGQTKGACAVCQSETWQQNTSLTVPACMYCDETTGDWIGHSGIIYPGDADHCGICNNPSKVGDGRVLADPSYPCSSRIDGKTFCNETTWKCDCPPGKKWDGEKCVIDGCHLDTDCEGIRMCNQTTKVCCPSDKPYWNGSACVACLTNYGGGLGACPTVNNPLCHTSVGTCGPCPAGQTWNTETLRCEAPQSPQMCITLYQYKGSRKNGQGKEMGKCCSPDQKLISKTKNTLFKGYKSGENTQYGCCPVNRIYMDRGNESCCDSSKIAVAGSCCSIDKIYIRGGQQKCCSGYVRDNHCYKSETTCIGCRRICSKCHKKGDGCSAVKENQSFSIPANVRITVSGSPSLTHGKGDCHSGSGGSYINYRVYNGSNVGSTFDSGNGGTLSIGIHDGSKNGDGAVLTCVNATKEVLVD